jgi:hypothetical protein
MKYYLFAILENICCILGLLFILSSIAMVFYIVGRVVLYDDDDFGAYLKKIGKWFVPFYIILTLVGTFIPSQKQMAFIIAAPYILENKDLQDSAQNTAEIIKMGTEYLKKALEEKTNGK